MPQPAQVRADRCRKGDGLAWRGIVQERGEALFRQALGEQGLGVDAGGHQEPVAVMAPKRRCQLQGLDTQGPKIGRDRGLAAGARDREGIGRAARESQEPGVVFRPMHPDGNAPAEFGEQRQQAGHRQEDAMFEIERARHAFARPCLKVRPGQADPAVRRQLDVERRQRRAQIHDMFEHMAHHDRARAQADSRCRHPETHPPPQSRAAGPARGGHWARGSSRARGRRRGDRQRQGAAAAADIDHRAANRAAQEFRERRMMAGPGRAEAGGVTGLIDALQRRQDGDLSRAAAAAFRPGHGRQLAGAARKDDTTLKYRIGPDFDKLFEPAITADGTAAAMEVFPGHSQSFRKSERPGLLRSVLTATAAG